MNDRGIQESGVGSNELGFARLRYIVRLEKFDFLRRTCGIFMVMVNLIRFKSVGYLLVEYPESVGAATNGKDSSRLASWLLLKGSQLRNRLSN